LPVFRMLAQSRLDLRDEVGDGTSTQVSCRARNAALPAATAIPRRDKARPMPAARPRPAPRPPRRRAFGPMRSWAATPSRRRRAQAGAAPPRHAPLRLLPCRPIRAFGPPRSRRVGRDRRRDRPLRSSRPTSGRAATA
jgi:hypothetical protein